MKFNNILKGAMGLVVAGVMTGCAGDYLDVAPVTNVTDNEVISTVDGARSGMYGVCRSMAMQYSDMSGYMFFNGEGWIDMFYGDVMGQDYVSLMWQQQMGNINYNWGSMTLPNGWQSRLMWMYCYNLINQSNRVLDGIDTAEGDDAERSRVKACLLTIRAHAYIHLLQCYAPRWQDSGNGSVKCVIIRNTNDGVDVPLSSMAEVLDYIYKDLDNAIALFTSSDKKRSFEWEPNIEVAKGLYARAALLKEDWKTAQKMAHEARQGHEIMTMDQYKGGFAEANQEWMWNNACDSYFLYYWATGSLYGCNGAYATIWRYGAGAINLDLYNMLDENDQRRDLFWTPDKVEDRSYNLTGSLSPEDFFDTSCVDPSSMNCNANNNWMILALKLFGADKIPNGDVAKWGNPYEIRSPDVSESQKQSIYITIGAQYKFWGVDYLGTNSFPFMRGAELLLTEAEAAYHNGEEGVAKPHRIELNSKRIKNYTCTSTGSALLDEIRLSRRIELWGEGHSWFDLKRWNMPLVRSEWVEGDPT